MAQRSFIIVSRDYMSRRGPTPPISDCWILSQSREIRKMGISTTISWILYYLQEDREVTSADSRRMKFLSSTAHFLMCTSGSNVFSGGQVVCRFYLYCQVRLISFEKLNFVSKSGSLSPGRRTVLSSHCSAYESDEMDLYNNVYIILPALSWTLSPSLTRKISYLL